MTKGRKTGGRVAGTPNKATRITRNLINDLAAGLYDKVVEDIEMLEPKDRVHVFLKLVEFNVSKPQSVAIDIMQEGKKTIEDRLAELSGDDEEE